MIWTITLSLLGKTLHWKLQVFDTPKGPTMGMSSRVPGTTEHCIFLDYEPIVDEVLKESLKDLQTLFELGDFYVFETGQYRRHAICLDRMSMREALAVLMESDSDYNFKRGIKINEFRGWVLRVFPKGDRPKPKFLYSVESEFNGQRFQHEGHAIFLQSYYGVPVRLVKPDGNTELKIQGYKTASHLDVRKLGEIDIKKLLLS
jgi:hypothetical protein